jgi:hypothetical protein
MMLIHVGFRSVVKEELNANEKSVTPMKIQLHAGRGLQPRPERFDSASFLEPYNKPCGWGLYPIRL